MSKTVKAIRAEMDKLIASGMTIEQASKTIADRNVAKLTRADLKALK
jgi:hypothetical protein